MKKAAAMGRLEKLLLTVYQVEKGDCAMVCNFILVIIYLTHIGCAPTITTGSASWLPLNQQKNQRKSPKKHPRPLSLCGGTSSVGKYGHCPAQRSFLWGCS